jgi:hypothetical protein
MTTTPPALQLRELPVQEIEPNLSQARRYFDQATLQELASSMKERGVLQPVLGVPVRTASTSWSRGSGAGAQPSSPVCLVDVPRAKQP